MRGGTGEQDCRERRHLAHHRRSTVSGIRAAPKPFGLRVIKPHAAEINRWRHWSESPAVQNLVSRFSTPVGPAEVLTTAARRLPMPRGVPIKVRIAPEEARSRPARLAPYTCPAGSRVIERPDVRGTAIGPAARAKRSPLRAPTPSAERRAGRGTSMKSIARYRSRRDTVHPAPVRLHEQGWLGHSSIVSMDCRGVAVTDGAWPALIGMPAVVSTSLIRYPSRRRRRET